MYLAVECGATKSLAVFYDKNRNEIHRYLFGSANYKLLSSGEFSKMLDELKHEFRKFSVKKLALAMPGLASASDRQSAKEAVRRIWEEIDPQFIWTGGDTYCALACIEPSNDNLKLVCIGGTGSSFLGSNSSTTESVGGFGHILGDQGSSYDIAFSCIRRCIKKLDRGEELSLAPKGFFYNGLFKDGFSSTAEIISWAQKASKPEIAKLAVYVLRAWEEGLDEEARNSVEDAIDVLSSDCIALIKKLVKGNSSENLSINAGITGSLFVKNPLFTDLFIDSVQKLSPKNWKIKFQVLEETVAGGIQLLSQNEKPYNCMGGLNNVLPISTALPETERRNPRSMSLSSMTTEDAFDLMISEESKIYSEIAKQKENISKLVDIVTRAFQTGGRLFYVGSGTSGRLGILDASECPPTFKSPPEWVQGIIAGGYSAITKAIEGAEDSIQQGMNAISEKDICSKDIVMGIAASGKTPFVWGAIHMGKYLGATTVLLTFNKYLEFQITPDIHICVSVGPEILTGSTRLKSGSATKCILNLISTLSMVKYGKCYENLMVDLKPANAKLRDRAYRIVVLLTKDWENITNDIVQQALIKNGYDIKKTMSELELIKHRKTDS